MCIRLERGCSQHSFSAPIPGNFKAMTTAQMRQPMGLWPVPAVAGPQRNSISIAPVAAIKVTMRNGLAHSGMWTAEICHF